MTVADDPARSSWLRNALAGRNPSARLPARIRDAIARQQDLAERLIGAVQLLIVLTFGTLYFISPTPSQMELALEPVPFALAAYLVFTLLRVWLSFRVRLPDWFLMLSIFIDIGLLMVLIWSFHIQYGQSPPFYLKIPTLIYVFIFISLRTLRFEPRFVAVAGITAAAGWGLLLANAVASVDDEVMITRDFVRYLSSPDMILIGAEFDKMISILVVTAILVIAQVRARALLVRAVTEGQAAADLSRFFDSSLARTITGAEAEIVAGEGQARDAAILFIDIRGFTDLATEISPTELIHQLADYQAQVVPVIQANGGVIDEFLGDGIMATFGAAAESDTYAADAMRAAVEVMAAVERWNAARAAAGNRRLNVNAAVAAGRIVFGAVGDENRLEYTVIGGAVNLAAKLEKHTKTERVRALATAASFATAVDQGLRQRDAPRRLPARSIAGVADPTDLVVLVP